MEKNQGILAFRCPRFAELPQVDLYARQVLDYVSRILKPLFPDEASIITGAMINNYIKLGAITSPQAKSYSKDHLCRIIVITILKTVFSISEIHQMFGIQKATYPIDIAYDYFCSEFENALKAAFLFTGEALPSIETKRTEQTILIRAMVLAVANKIYVQYHI